MNPNHPKTFAEFCQSIEVLMTLNFQTEFDKKDSLNEWYEHYASKYNIDKALTEWASEYFQDVKDGSHPFSINARGKMLLELYTLTMEEFRKRDLSAGSYVSNPTFGPGIFPHNITIAPPQIEGSLLIPPDQCPECSPETWGQHRPGVEVAIDKECAKCGHKQKPTSQKP